ncbi:hypothetical protein HNQ02_003425 [Flavobacterium sp. 7E]|uniref:hypothetical protein n=1 Tax=Flavobacterium sp. 7E TaxID=2735898 RepID=UPI00156EA787|nr:hypothetical protein [Flavobacterium sp. 7E]NRS90481.1 hypothetical protein [Flavobacterium sp. 7E]
MKRVLGLLVFAMLFNSCDDGNLIQEDISFEDVTATQSCTDNDIIYKLKDNEALLVEIPSVNFTDEDSDLTETTLTISSTTNRVVYRFYNGTVTADNICETIPPITPAVTDQWIATGGTIVITKEAKKETDATDNSTRISGYSHNIVFKNITFSKSTGGTQVYDVFNFGSYVTTATTLPFGFDETKALNKCSTNDQVYKFTTGEAMELSIDPSLIINEITVANSPRKGIIGTTQNKLTYRLFTAGLLTADYFCNATTPATPTVNQEWNGVAGVTDKTGLIEVTTTTSGPSSFKHTIVLKNTTLSKGNYSFSLGDNYTLGVLYTSN